MANVKKIVLPGTETAETWVVTVIQDATEKVLDDTDGDFRSPAALQTVQLEEHLVANGFPEDIEKIYELSESRKVWADGTYTVIANQSGWTEAPRIGKMLVVNDVEVVLWQSPK